MKTMVNSRVMYRLHNLKEGQILHGPYQIDQGDQDHHRAERLEEQGAHRQDLEFNTSKITMLKEFYKIKPQVRE